MASFNPSIMLMMKPCLLNCGFMKLTKFIASTNSIRSRKTVHGLGLERSLLSREVLQSNHHDLTSVVRASSRVSVEQTEQLLETTRTKLETLKDVLTYRFHTEVGGQVKVSVEKKIDKYAVYIEVSIQQSLTEKGLVLVWGIYRSDSSCFVPLESHQLSSDIGTIETPFVKRDSRTFLLELEFNAKDTPSYICFVLKFLSNVNEGVLPVIKTHMREKFTVPIGSSRGNPDPLGISFLADGSVNFSIVSRNATGVILCLYDEETQERPALELDLDPYVNRSGHVWHTLLETTTDFVSYGYRLKGDKDKFDADHVRLDPYAKIIKNHVQANSTVKYLGELSKEPLYDWSNDIRPNIAIEKLMVYRLNVARFTKHKSSKLPSDEAGTFSGLCEKLHHFKSVGVNAVLLEPVFSFDERKGQYFPCNFFSSMNQYGSVTTMKEMVKEFHAHGIEVLLEVVFTYTAENGALQGIDDSSYYFSNKISRFESPGAMNCNYPVVQRLILDSLRHWVTEYRIDGFVFLNASSLLRGPCGENLSRPPLVEAIAFDPIISNCKIIADCWDPRVITQTQTQTRFPHWKRWAEINTNFSWGVRNYLRGEGLISNLATRLCGSGDIFSDGRGPAFSFNYISGNDGLSLVDLVSFSSSNLASQLSWNCGEEGATIKTSVLEKRLKQVRNFLFILYVSLGVPILNMGDECGQSSNGSPSYTDRKPLNWNSLATDFGNQTTKFISFMSSLRSRRNDLFQRRAFLEEENIIWHGTDSFPPKWDDPSCRFLGVTLKGSKGDMFIVFNAADHSEIVILPPPPEGMEWRRLVDTGLPFPGFFSIKGESLVGLDNYDMKPYSCILFEASDYTGLE